MENNRFISREEIRPFLDKVEKFLNAGGHSQKYQIDLNENNVLKVGVQNLNESARVSYFIQGKDVSPFMTNVDLDNLAIYDIAFCQAVAHSLRVSDSPIYDNVDKLLDECLDTFLDESVLYEFDPNRNYVLEAVNRYVSYIAQKNIEENIDSPIFNGIDPDMHWVDVECEVNQENNQITDFTISVKHYDVNSNSDIKVAVAPDQYEIDLQSNFYEELKAICDDYNENCIEPYAEKHTATLKEQKNNAITTNIKI